MDFAYGKIRAIGISPISRTQGDRVGMANMTAQGFYHCSVKSVGRATGRSSVAAAAYRAGVRLEDSRTGLMHDYTRKGGVVAAFIVLPDNAPAWAINRGDLWNACEAATTAKNGRLATELELALPHELTASQRRGLIERFARELSDRYKVAVDVAIHGPGRGGDTRNHHAHVMLTHRELGPDGFGVICNRREKTRLVKGVMKTIEVAGINEEDTSALRVAWGEALNAAYQSARLDIRADHRSHADRGMTAEPTQHLGPSATALERRGEVSNRGDDNRAIRMRNAQRERIEAQRVTLAAAIADLVAERDAKAEGREMRAAIRTASATRILESLTERRATFTRGELIHALQKGVDSRAEAADLAKMILAEREVIGLREDANAPVSRYTTRAVIAQENAILASGRALAAQGRGGLSERQKAAAMKNHKHLDEEQRAAFDFATNRGGLTVIAGEAGTGKSTTLAAIREAYEGAGHRVIGLAWTGKVVDNMRGDGFTNASTVASALNAQEAPSRSRYNANTRNGVARPVMGGRQAEKWNAKTVLVVDEAAQISTKHLGRLLDVAQKAGAKVILSGDDKQLASIERGGMFSALAGEHGAAELHNVRRVQDEAQRRAFNYMHAGKFGAALDIFDQTGAIRWTQTQDEARAELVAQWAKDTAEQPDKSRFVFAYSNADVDKLNSELRAIRRERGELGADSRLNVKGGAADFAPGDRVQFTGSAYYATDKARGLVNGSTGTLRAVEGQTVTVELDGKNGKPGRSVSFTVGDHEEAGQFNAMRHGYAGTIYKGQGATLDQTYLYHSQNWRASSAYVALSRHRDRAALFVAREVTRGAEPWMMQAGGLDALDERQKASAARSYEAWAEEKPAAAEKYGLADYVAYVQEKQGERDRSAFDMEQLARQVSRADETRAASQFVADSGTESEKDKERGKTKGTDGKRPSLSGSLRLAGMADAARAMLRRGGAKISDLMPRARRDAAPHGKYDDLKAAHEYAQQQKNSPATPTSERDKLFPPLSVEAVDAERKRREVLGKDKPKGLGL